MIDNNQTTPKNAPESDFKYTIKEDGVHIIGYTGKAEEFSIPSTIEGIPVTVIEPTAFTSNTTIKEIVIPEGVTEIL